MECVHYLGDRPCRWHKQYGDVCICSHYFTQRENILIIKLDAMGDVLRTASLLPAMISRWPGIRITWITRLEAVPLLQNNPYIAEIIPYGVESLLHLSTRRFDTVINLDASKISSGMATLANAREKIGFLLHEQGYVHATNAESETWLKMGIFDDLKKANTRSYQDIMCAILDIPSNEVHYELHLREDELLRAREHLFSIGVDLTRPIIGIHTGGGGRWGLKQWSESKFTTLIAELQGRGIQIVIFGGPLERELNQRIADSVQNKLFDAGCDNEVRHFAALLKCCSVVLSGDTLAMHISLSMGCRTVVLFGPTSSAEIALFGLGEKITPAMDCLCCYKQKCDFSPNCMDMISVADVKDAILRQMEMAIDGK